MNDRELLEMAAKSVGVQICWDDLNYPWISGRSDIFDPEHDGAEALSLAVKNGLTLKMGEEIGIRVFAGDGIEVYELIGADGDRARAARRAIVRASAEIGKSM